MNHLLSTISALLLSFPVLLAVEPKVTVVKPDLQNIKDETTTEGSRFYYPDLLRSFMSNDTVMTQEDFRYFYYGALFQEDYDPYRTPIDADELKSLEPLYHKNEHSRDEKSRIERYAKRALADNPLDLRQLAYLVFVYEKNNKINLAKIWKNKLNNLLLVIASSGTGLDTDNAWIVAFPSNEYDFLNLSGITAEAQDYVPPYFDHITVHKKTDKDAGGYYFNIRYVLEQYYIKHPSEMDDQSGDEAI